MRVLDACALCQALRSAKLSAARPLQAAAEEAQRVDTNTSTAD
jgi:hypothetical protein